MLPAPKETYEPPNAGRVLTDSGLGICFEQDQGASEVVGI
jgi:hypothetical protein